MPVNIAEHYAARRCPKHGGRSVGLCIRTQRGEEAYVNILLTSLSPPAGFSPLFVSQRGLCHFKLHDFDSALFDLTRSLQLLESAVTYNARGDVYRALNQLPASIADYQMVRFQHA